MKLKRFRAQIMVLQTIDIQASSLNDAAAVAMIRVREMHFSPNDLPSPGQSGPCKAKMLSVAPVVEQPPLLPKVA